MAARKQLRRSNGEGTVFQRTSDNRWVARVTYVDEATGRQRHKEHSASTKDAALERLGQLKDEVRGSGLPEGRTPTVGEWLTHWLATSAKGRVSENTLDAYHSIVTHHLIPLLGRRKLDTSLRAHHLERAYATMAAGRPCGKPTCPKLEDKQCTTCRPPLAPSSVLKAHRIISRALRVASRDFATLNPDVVDAPSVRRHRADAYMLAEVAKIVTTLAATRNGVRWLIGMLLGMRQGEVLGLWWDDIDLDTGVVTVRARAHRRKGGGIVRRPLKNDDSIRDIALPPELVTQLQAHRKAQVAERLAAGTDWVHDGRWVFTGRVGRPLRPERDVDAWYALCDAAGVRRMAQHAGTRHTVATLLLEAGINPRIVMEILGHSQVSVTLNTYSHVRANVVRSAVDGLAASLFPTPVKAPSATSFHTSAGGS
jgi:integrase